MYDFVNHARGTLLSLGRCAMCGLLLAVMCFATGCAKFDLRRKIPWSDEVPDDPASPTKVVAVWSEAVLHQTGKPAMRGFGGRLFFYGTGGEKESIKVDGTLVVYAFDETDPEQAKVTPDRKYVFPAENLEQHRTESSLGHSYLFWVPWDEAGGEQRRISLVVRFTPRAGAIVISRQDSQVLPGRPPENQPETSLAGRSHNFGRGRPPIRQVSYSAPTATGRSLAAQGTRPLEVFRQQRGMVTTTIPIAGSLGHRPPTSITRRRPFQAPFQTPFQTPSRTLMRRPVDSAASSLGQSRQPPRDATWSRAARQNSRPSTRFSRARSRVLGAPIERLDRGRSRWQRPPATSPYDSRSSLPPAPPVG